MTDEKIDWELVAAQTHKALQELTDETEKKATDELLKKLLKEQEKALTEYLKDQPPIDELLADQPKLEDVLGQPIEWSENNKH